MNPRILVVPFLVATAIGCGGKVVIDASGGGGESSTSSSSGTVPSNPDCDTFCQTVNQPACPKGDDCLERCNLAFERGCEAELSALLECLPPWIQADCLIFYPNQNAPCDPVINGYESCMIDQATGASATCGGVNTSLVGTNSCTGEGDCEDGQRRVECTGQGICTCSVAGKEIGTCKNLINGVEHCNLYTSCCSALFNQL